MTYNEALEYIHSVSWKGSRPGLERISELCRLLGNPQDDLKFIHVAGTNGKGSFCRMISEILTRSGYRVGLYTSPFIERFNERIMIDGMDISNEDLAEATEKVKQFACQMTDTPTEFELITAIAFVYYKSKKCDYVVLEAGLGGRLDSTNIIKTPILSVITGIDLDHMAILGDTTALIAKEKAGIIKDGIPVLFGEGDTDALDVVKKEAELHGCEFTAVDYSKISHVKSDLGKTSFRYDNKEYSIKMLGLYQTRNAANVISAVKILRKAGIEISDEALCSGLSSAFWKARFEVLKTEPLIIYDGAHNSQGIRGAVENIKHYLEGLTSNGKVVLLMGVMADKEHHEMIRALSEVAHAVYAVTPNNERSLASSAICDEFAEFSVPALYYGKIDDGVFAAVSRAKEENIPLVCLGSLYMYADVKAAVFKYTKQD